MPEIVGILTAIGGIAMLLYKLHRANKDAEAYERQQFIARLSDESIVDINRRKSERPGDWL